MHHLSSSLKAGKGFFLHKKGSFNVRLRNAMASLPLYSFLLFHVLSAWKHQNQPSSHVKLSKDLKWTWEITQHLTIASWIGKKIMTYAQFHFCQDCIFSWVLQFHFHFLTTLLKFRFSEKATKVWKKSSTCFDAIE